MEKVAELHMPDQIYNWIVDFLCNHSHCTRYANVNSSVATVTASIIQGSGQVMTDKASGVLSQCSRFRTTPGR